MFLRVMLLETFSFSTQVRREQMVTQEILPRECQEHEEMLRGANNKYKNVTDLFNIRCDICKNRAER